ncbi:CesT family type III secretion system chaperone [Ramlibacter sp. AN1015]|uniref:CesT family type III secretion system chaperone n=1 Tax=Ramlibacter sp. AN1015 TaxID=3133428 RepID=UPI0030C5484C
MPNRPSLLQPLADALASTFGSEFRIADDGALHLATQDGRTISAGCSPDGQDIVFHSVLAVLDGPHDLVRMTAALACNLHQEQTCGGAIGLDVTSGALVFSWRIPGADASEALLMTSLDGYCATVEALANRLDEAEAALSPEEAVALAQRSRAASSLDRHSHLL